MDVDSDRQRIIEAFEMWIWGKCERSAGLIKLLMRNFAEE